MLLIIWIIVYYTNRYNIKVVVQLEPKVCDPCSTLVISVLRCITLFFSCDKKTCNTEHGTNFSSVSPENYTFRTLPSLLNKFIEVISMIGLAVELTAG